MCSAAQSIGKGLLTSTSAFHGITRMDGPIACPDRSRLTHSDIGQSQRPLPELTAGPSTMLVWLSPMP